MIYRLMLNGLVSDLLLKSWEVWGTGGTTESHRVPAREIAKKFFNPFFGEMSDFLGERKRMCALRTESTEAGSRYILYIFLVILLLD